MPCGSRRVVRLGEVREHGADDVEVAEHGRREEMEACFVLDQGERDLTPAHGRGRRRVQSSRRRHPSPTLVDEAWLLGEERADDLQIAVRVRDEGLNLRGIELRGASLMLAPPLLRLAGTPAEDGALGSELPTMRFLPWVSPTISPQAKTPASVVSACSEITRPPFW